jgi:transcriptional regulator with XRE-family HTH domain
MVERENELDVPRLLVVFLRFYAQMTQAEFGKACAVQQGDISRYEAGQKAPSEEILKRMAAAAGLPWQLVVHLRRFFGAVLKTSDLWRAIESGTTELDRAVVETVMAAVTCQLVEAEIEAASSPHATENSRREAEEVWTRLEHLPAPQRRRLLALSLRAGRSWALVVRICEASARAAAEHPGEALDLAELALSVAERVPGEEGWRSRVRGYAWAHVANARQAAEDVPGAAEAFAVARDLWRAGAVADPGGLIPESRWVALERGLG